LKIDVWQYCRVVWRDNYSTNIYMIFIKVLKVIPYCVICCGWNAVIKVRPPGLASSILFCLAVSLWMHSELCGVGLTCC